MRPDQRPYAVDVDGNPIVPEEGWKILPEGHKLVSGHRRYDSAAIWSSKWRHGPMSTMIPIWACTWGTYLAYAVPVDFVTEEFPGWRTAYDNPNIPF